MLLWMHMEKACARRDVRLVRCGYFHPPLWCPSMVDHQRDSNFWLEAVVDWFFPLPRFVPQRTRPPATPLRRRRKRWVCFLLFLPEVSPCYSLLFTFFSFTANWYSWCCFTGIVCVLQFAWFSTFPNVSVHATDVVGGILHYQRVFFSFECSSFAVRPSCVRLGSFVVCNLHLFPQRSAQPS